MPLVYFIDTLSNRELGERLITSSNLGTVGEEEWAARESKGITTTNKDDFLPGFLQTNCGGSVHIEDDDSADESQERV